MPQRHLRLATTLAATGSAATQDGTVEVAMMVAAVAAAVAAAELPREDWTTACCPPGAPAVLQAAPARTLLAWRWHWHLSHQHCCHYHY